MREAITSLILVDHDIIYNATTPAPSPKPKNKILPNHSNFSHLKTLDTVDGKLRRSAANDK
jgi:hypothetical protein